MKFQSNIHVLSFLRIFVIATSIIVFGVGLLVMLGWIMDIPTLRSILPGLPAMRFNTAVSLLFLGSSLWFLQNEETSPAQKGIGKALAGLALLISLLTLSEYLFGWNLGIDELFIKDASSPRELFPGRMSPIAVLCSWLSSTSLLLMGSRISQYFSVGVFVLAIVAIMDFLFDFRALFRNPQNTYSAVQTAGTFLGLSLAILAARPDRGMMKILSSNLPGSKAMRLLLPVMIILTVMMGWLVERAESFGYLENSQDSIILVILLIIVYSPLIYFSARNINRAEEGMVYANRLYSTLSQVNQAIARVKSQQELFESICRIVVDFGKFRLAWIGLFDPDSGHLTPVAVYSSAGLNLPFEDINAREMPFKEGLIGVALTLGQAQFSDDLMIDHRMLHWREIALQDDYHSAAVIPIRRNRQIVGLLNLYAADAGFFMVREEQSLLEEIGLNISFALDAMESEMVRKQAEEQVRRQLKQLTALRLIDTAISSSFDLHVILEVVLQQVLAQLDVDASALLLFDSRFQAIEYAASRGFRSDALHHTKLKIGEGYASQAVLNRKTIHISALMETGGKLAQALQGAKEEFVDYHGTPLIVKGEVKGVLEIYNRSQLQDNTEWLEFLEALAGQAAIAIDNAQLFENLQRSNANLERRVAERTAELNRTNTELEHASRAKDEFLANMSHELRTPLTSILGLSESLLEQRRGSLNDHQQRSLEVIESSGQHLLQLINDILDLSKIEAGKFDFYPQPVSVDEVCRSSLSFVKAQATKKSINVTYIQDSSIPKIFADPRRLKQILVNLLNNAVKFTLEHGEVILQVNADLQQDLVKFSVIDNGIGISQEDLRQLFQPFVQVDRGLNRQHDGTGLGLALVQKLTDLHGGCVQVESEVGKGSRFTVSLPCLQEEVRQLAKLESHQTLRMSEQAESTEVRVEAPEHLGLILVADDNMSSILTIGEYLESHGYEVVVAHDGVEALKKAEEMNPDLILMDIQMPVMNGLEAIAHLRDKLQFATTPIIALTALAMPGDRERTLLAGASEYMSKPASLRALRQKIANLLHGQSGT